MWLIASDERRMWGFPPNLLLAKWSGEDTYKSEVSWMLVRWIVEKKLMDLDMNLVRVIVIIMVIL